jgi:acyl-CoA reductase-like NAD-dependent aldehyde dehydrogenase
MNDRAQGERVLEVRYPFTGEVVGTVPKAGVDEVRKAFAAAHAFKPTLTRYERATIMQKAAALLRSRTAEASDLITRESGLSKKDSLYEVGRVCDVLTFSAMEALRDDGQS